MLKTGLVRFCLAKSILPAFPDKHYQAIIFNLKQQKL